MNTPTNTRTNTSTHTTAPGPWKDAEPGVTRRLVAAGDTMMAMEVRFEPGAEGARHSHPHEQLSRLLAGRLTFYLGDDERELGAGDVIVIPGGLEHGVLAHEESLLIDVFSPLREDLLEALR